MHFVRDALQKEAKRFFYCSAAADFYRRAFEHACKSYYRTFLIM